MKGINGAEAAQAAPIQINPQDVARAALMFLGRADFKSAERQTFDMVEALLGAIVRGEIVLTQRADESQPALAPAIDAPAPTPAPLQ